MRATPLWASCAKRGGQYWALIGKSVGSPPIKPPFSAESALRCRQTPMRAPATNATEHASTPRSASGCACSIIAVIAPSGSRARPPFSPLWWTDDHVFDQPTQNVQRRRADGFVGQGLRQFGDLQARKHAPSRRRQGRKVHMAMDTQTGDVRGVGFTSGRQGRSRQIASQSPAGQWMAMIKRDDATQRSSIETPMRSYRSTATGAPGRKKVLPQPPVMTSGTPHAIWAGRSGNDGRDITIEIGWRPG